MKGIVFTEFLEMVEKEFGLEIADHIIENSKLESQGAYTAIGTYSHDEMLQLISNLSTKTETDIPILLKAFGRYLFDTFLSSYPGFFERTTSAFDFLESIENHIHVEVRKLYSDAELPSFTTQRVEDIGFEMIYSSERKMADFAEGLIERTMEYYKTPYEMKKVNINEEGSMVKFTIMKK